MADADIAKTGLARAVARFPEATAALHRLALTDPEFREICEEYAWRNRASPGSRRVRTPPSGPRSTTTAR